MKVSALQIFRGVKIILAGVVEIFEEVYLESYPPPPLREWKVSFYAYGCKKFVKTLFANGYGGRVIPTLSPTINADTTISE